MKKESINTKAAATPVGPYSHAVKYGDFYFISGQTPEDPFTGETVRGTIAEQTKSAMDNLKAVIEDTGLTMDEVLKVTIYMTKPEYFKEMNAVYATYFNKESGYPARICTFGSELYDGVDIEIEAICGKNTEK